MSAQIQIRNNKIFGILLLISEIILIFMFGFFISYTGTYEFSQYDDYLIIATMILVALCGFGLITTYVRAASVASLTHLIIIFGFSIQLYFPLRGMWAIISLPSPAQPQDRDHVLPISVTNVVNDRHIDNLLWQSPFTEYIACFISLIVGYSGFIGRVGNLEVFIYTIVGTFIYEFNSLVFWRLFIMDCGYGMRIFLFGGIMGLVTSLILNKRDTTISHRRFKSDQYFQVINLIGAIFIWCLISVLNLADLWRVQKATDQTVFSYDKVIAPVAVINMVFALCGSVVGATCVSVLLHKKLSAHIFVFSIFSGGIGYTSISNLYYNPGVAMSIGTIVGIISSLLIGKLKSMLNKKGIIDSNGIIGSYLIPGLIAGILSAIFHAAKPPTYSSNYNPRSGIDSSMSDLKQGGMQLAGVFISIGCGILTGIISGFLMKIVNKRQSEDQFNPDFIANQVPVQKIQDKKNH